MQTGSGTSLECNDGTGGTFVLVPDVIDIDPPGTESSANPRPYLAQTTHKLKFPGLPDPGEFGFGYEVTFPTFHRLQSLYGVEKSWRVTFPDGLRLSFNGWIRMHRGDKVQGETIVTARCVVVLTTLIAVSDVTP